MAKLAEIMGPKDKNGNHCHGKITTGLIYIQFNEPWVTVNYALCLVPEGQELFTAYLTMG